MITFKEETITVQVRKIKDEVYEQQLRLAQVAYADGKATGLAYYTYLDDDEIVYRLTHVPTGGTILSSEYDLGSEKEMKRWIELCLEFADWTLTRPRITSIKHALKYAAIGAFEQA